MFPLCCVCSADWYFWWQWFEWVKIGIYRKKSFSSQNCSCGKSLHPTLLAHPIMGLMLGYTIKTKQCTSSAKKLKVWSNDIRARHPLKISLRVSYNLPFIAKTWSFMLYAFFFFFFVLLQSKCRMWILKQINEPLTGSAREFFQTAINSTLSCSLYM